MVATNFLGVVILSLWAGAAAFSIDPSVRSNRQQTKVEMTTSRSTRTRRTDQINISRRRIFSSIIPAVTLASAALVAKPESSFAKDELFKSNPLLNPILEKIRILEQAEADNIQYSGELAPGSPKGRESYAKLLVPILTIQRDLIQIDDLAHLEDGKGLNDADKLLTKPYFEKIGFKKVFNAFADNIYYSDPDRANAYLGGGAVPKNEQSIAYLLRNDVLTNVENLQAEVAYMIKEQKAGNPLETEDLYLYAKICKEGMVKYLELVPPGEMKLAAEILASS